MALMTSYLLATLIAVPVSNSIWY